jgi:hypothetical protein
MLTCYEQTIGQRRTMGSHSTAPASRAAQAKRWTAADSRSSGACRDHLCVEVRHPVGDVAPGAGVWQWGDLLETVTRLAGGRSLGPAASTPARPVRGSRPDRLDAGLAGFSECARKKGGDETGPNPTDKGKPGTKRHVVVDRRGIPLVALLSGANRHDSMLFERLITAIPPIKTVSGGGGSDPRSCTRIRATTFPAVGSSWDNGASSVASPGRASRAARDWGGIDGSWNAPSPGWPSTAV